MHEIQGLLNEARQAIETYKKQHSSLYAGKYSKFPKEEHAERVAHYRAERNKVLAAVEERAGALYADALGSTEVSPADALGPTGLE